MKSWKKNHNLCHHMNSEHTCKKHSRYTAINRRGALPRRSRYWMVERDRMGWIRWTHITQHCRRFKAMRINPRMCRRIWSNNRFSTILSNYPTWRKSNSIRTTTSTVEAILKLFRVQTLSMATLLTPLLRSILADFVKQMTASSNYLKLPSPTSKF